MNLRRYLGSMRRLALCSLYRRRVPLGKAGPIVSFTFDDFPRTAYTVGGAILERFGARGTYYVTCGLMNRVNELGELFNPDDLHALVHQGHELATQTFNHADCRRMPLAFFIDDVQKGIKALQHIEGHNSANFAYPYGHVTFRSKKILGPALNSSRSNFAGFNGPRVDLNLLRANPLYGDARQSTLVEELIHRNAIQKTWLIFYTHDVRPTPSAYGCTPELLEYAVSLASRSGSRILPVQDALAEIGIGESIERRLSYAGV